MCSDILQFIERNVSPFGVLPITAEDGKTEEEVLTVKFSDEPVTAADEQMEVNEIIAVGSVLGLVEARKFG